MIDDSMIDQLREEYEQHFKVLREGGIYCWSASGGIRDFFLQIEPRDIDLFFVNVHERNKALNTIIDAGGEKVFDIPRGVTVRYNSVRYDLICWDGSGDPPCVSDTPEKTIEWLDYTVEMAALDINGKFVSHPRFYKDTLDKKLVRNPIHRIQDLYVRMNNNRLLKYIRKGYSIDSKNLIEFLEDQEATFVYRYPKAGPSKLNIPDSSDKR